jgi:hypothetical protein
VQSDELGRYTALLGAMHTDGLPIDLFTSGEVRWLGIQVGLEAEQQPRVLLVSVPYALKAGDSETLGGKPASAYMLSNSQNGTVSATTTTTSTTAGAQAGTSGKAQKGRKANASPLVACSSLTSDGTATANSITMFTTACNIESSLMTQVGSNIGIGTTNPQAMLHVQEGSIRLGRGVSYPLILDQSLGSIFTITNGLGKQLSFDYNGNLGIQDGSLRLARGGSNALILDQSLGSIFTITNGVGQQMAFDSNGSLGIGTAIPYARVHIQDGSLLLARGGSNFLILDQSLGSIFTITNGVNGPQLAFDYNGNLGLGTTSPLARVHIQDGSLRFGRGGSYPVILDQSLGSIFTITNGLGKQLAFDYNGNLSITGSLNSALVLQASVTDASSPGCSGAGNCVSADVLAGYMGATGGNTITAGVTGATIAGGGGSINGAPVANTVTDDWGTVGGGYANQTGDNAGTVSDHCCATVAGGFSNTASGTFSTASGGNSNTASGDTSTVAGGGANTAGGQYSYAAGCAAKAVHDGAFVWSGYNGSFCTVVTSSVAGQFIALAPGGVTFYSQTPVLAGESLAAGGGSWASVSDRNLKDHLMPVDGRTLLARLNAIPMASWNYKAQPASIRHLGPMAQDFYAAFGLGEDDKHITNGAARREHAHGPRSHQPENCEGVGHRNRARRFLTHQQCAPQHGRAEHFQLSRPIQRGKARPALSLHHHSSFRPCIYPLM